MVQITVPRYRLSQSALKKVLSEIFRAEYGVREFNVPVSGHISVPYRGRTA